MWNCKLRALVASLALLTCWIPAHIQAAEQPTYTIENVKGNVYRFVAGHYRSAFLVTDEGIIVTDPLGAEAAKYLSKALKKRFNLPVRYMIYSHNHVDHTQGGEIFAEAGAIVIAHQYAAEDLEWTQAPTAMPSMTFRDEMTVELGKHQVKLRYHGPNNGRGSISMRFLPENVIHVVDWIVLGRMMYQDLPGYDIHGVIRSTREVLAMELFDILIGGHADMGSREDVEHYLGYIESLYDAVRDGMLAGKSLQQLQQEVRLPEYSDLKMYEEWLPLNVAGVHRTLNDMSYFNLRTDISQ